MTRPITAAILTAFLCIPAMAEDKPAADRSPVPEGINDNFLNPDLNPEEWLQRFEIESREVFAGRESILKAVALQPGMSIADVGTGTGLYMGPFSKAVGDEGRVFAVDISPKFIEHITRRIKADELHNVQPVLSNDRSITLEPEVVDRVFICDTYHHFEFHKDMLASIRKALKPGGELILVEFDRIPGTSREWLLTHIRADKATFRGEIEAAGLEFIDEVEIPEFKENYLLRFRKPAE
ncbi:MAG: class I SAM-dependent methyltransferase [Planctomycetaceae bacterium]